MTLARALELAQKALTRSPRHTFGRIAEETRRVARRPWSRVYPSIFNDAALLRATGTGSIDELWQALATQPFFVSAATRAGVVHAVEQRYPGERERVVEAAERVLRHEFDLLGSGPVQLGQRLPWHEDFKTGRRWPLEYSPSIEYSELDRPTDVKVPWELSRCQHFPVLGQAYWMTGDERYAREYVAEVTDWIAENPWGHGVNWACAMDVALRAVSWIWGFYFFSGSEACADPAFRSQLLRSLYLHGEWVATHLEKGPVNGNHYLSDGVGLVFLGCFFARASKGRAWLATGRALVLDEMLLQVTADGVDFEVSLAYHRLVMELFLTAYQLLRLHGEEIPPPQWERLLLMAEFIEAYTKPDGRVPLVGDADDGRVQMLGSQGIGDHRYLLSTMAVLGQRGDLKRGAGRLWEETLWFLGPGCVEAFERLAEPVEPSASKAFPEGGFFVLRERDTHVFVDCGNVGMRGIGGHGHNDILSFELVLAGMPLVTDCGAYLYTASKEWRNRFRSTAFHATIQVDGEEVNRFVAPDMLWQMRADANPEDVQWADEGDVVRFRGSHSGYVRLESPVQVSREVRLAKSDALVSVVDTLVGAGEHQVTWRFPLEPGVDVDIQRHDVCFSRGDAQRWLLPVVGGRAIHWTVEPGWVSPSYGVKHETNVLTGVATVQLPFEAKYFFSVQYQSEFARQARERAAGLA